MAGLQIPVAVPVDSVPVQASSQHRCQELSHANEQRFHPVLSKLSLAQLRSGLCRAATGVARMGSRWYRQTGCGARGPSLQVCRLSFFKLDDVKSKLTLNNITDLAGL